MRSAVIDQPAPRSALSDALTRGVLGALAGYALVRLVGMVALWAALDRSGSQLWTVLTTSYDAEHLLGIATSGYDEGIGRRSNLAFFPLFPMMTRALGLMIGVPAAGVAISWIAGFAAAAGLFAIGRHLAGPRVGVTLVVLWGALPHAITQSLAYTETLFTALAAWALYAVLGRRWVSAGVLTFIAGLARPTASALIAVVVLAALREIWRHRGRTWRGWLAAVLAPMGWLGYLVWVGARSSEPGGWFGVQQRWGSEFDGGAYSLAMFGETASGGQTLQMSVVSLVLIGFVLLIAAGLRTGLRWELIAYGTLIVGLAMGTAGFYQAKARLVVPAFTLLIPIALWLARRSATVRWVVLATMAAGSAWYGTYLMIDAPRSP